MQQPLVVTSINPFARQTYQARCFNAWKALGIEARSVNAAREAAGLAEMGLTAEDILTVEIADTGQALFGKPLPRIQALLKRLEEDFPGRTVVLVNSDIFPAARVAGFMQSLLDEAPALALCREEAPTVETAEFLRREPYRGGLDTFVLTAESLRKVNAILARFEPSERMCFAVPGWDFMLGAVLVSSEVGGKIMDGGLFLHEKHRQAYGNIKEFAQFVPAMKAMGAVSSDDFTEAAAQFADRIHTACESHKIVAEMVRAAYYLQPRPATEPSLKALRISRHLTQAAPWIRWTYNPHLIACLAETRLALPQPDLFMSEAFFLRSANLHQRFGEMLAMILFEVLARPDLPQLVSTQYPRGNRHADVMRIIQREQESNSAQARIEFARLFGSELVEYAVFNPRLYNYLVLACENEHERNLIADIGGILRRERHAA